MKRLFLTIATWLATNSLAAASWVLAFYFFVLFHWRSGLPPVKDLDATDLVYLGLSLGLWLLPFAKTIKIWDFLTFEAKVKELKTTVDDFKQEMRQSLQLQASMINAVSNTANQNVHVNLPSMTEADEAKDQLDRSSDPTADFIDIEREIAQFLESEPDDATFALAKLRIQVETELRRILGKRMELDPISSKGRFLTARSLFRKFTEEMPQYKNLYPSFDYILRISNAAVHGQIVPTNHAHEAFYMGIKLLRILKGISPINSNKGFNSDAG